MRTAVSLVQRLLEQLKRRASVSATSASRLVEHVRFVTRAPQETRRKARFELVTFGRGGRFSRANIDRAYALFEHDDNERFTGPRR